MSESGRSERIYGDCSQIYRRAQQTLRTHRHMWVSLPRHRGPAHATVPRRVSMNGRIGVSRLGGRLGGRLRVEAGGHYGLLIFVRGCLLAVLNRRQLHARLHTAREADGSEGAAMARVNMRQVRRCEYEAWHEREETKYSEERKAQRA